MSNEWSIGDYISNGGSLGSVVGTIGGMVGGGYNGFQYAQHTTEGMDAAMQIIPHIGFTVGMAGTGAAVGMVGGAVGGAAALGATGAAYKGGKGIYRRVRSSDDEEVDDEYGELIEDGGELLEESDDDIVTDGGHTVIAPDHQIAEGYADEDLYREA